MEKSMKPGFSQPVTELIKKRISVRTYEEKPLPEEMKTGITDYFGKLSGPFQVKVRFKLLDRMETKEEENLKLGTYGVIKGASSFITAAVEKKPYGMEQLGYQMEELILYLTGLGLGTCWLAGTFSRSSFSKALGVGKDELVPVAVPVGIPGEKRSLLDSLMRSTAGSRKRKAWSELFFMDNFQSPLGESSAGQYAVSLEMVRLAPSASNKQPWRILYSGGNFHFYLKHASFYNRALGYDIQKLDIGIAMLHFEATARETGQTGRWGNAEPDIRPVPEECEYIISWIPG